MVAANDQSATVGTVIGSSSRTPCAHASLGDFTTSSRKGRRGRLGRAGACWRERHYGTPAWLEGRMLLETAGTVISPAAGAVAVHPFRVMLCRPGGRDPLGSKRANPFGKFFDSGERGAR